MLLTPASDIPFWSYLQLSCYCNLLVQRLRWKIGDRASVMVTLGAYWWNRLPLDLKRACLTASLRMQKALN